MTFRSQRRVSMKHCTSCGNPLPDGQKFCTGCGAKQQEAVSQPPVQQEEKRSTRKPISKRAKIISCSIAVVILIGLAAHLWLTAYFDPLNDLEAMDQAISNQDTDVFISQIIFEKDALLKEDHFFQYIKDQEWDHVRNQYLGILEAQAENASRLDQTIVSEAGTKLFTVKKKPLVFGLYSTYTVKAIPVNVMISTNLDDTELQIGDHTKTIMAEEPVELDQVYPGVYPIKANAKNLFGTFNYEDELTVEAIDENNFHVDFTGESFAINTNQFDATLFIDDKDTGKTLAELSEIGPIPEDSSIKMHAEWKKPDVGIVKSAVVTPKDVDWLGLDFMFEQDESDWEQEEADSIDDEDENEEDMNMDEAGDVVLAFRDAYETAVNTKDFSLIHPYLEEGSHAYKDLKNYISDLQDTDYHYDFTYNEILDTAEIDKETIEIKTKELFTFTNHLDAQTDYDREKLYHLIQSDNTYKITKIDYVETNRD